MINKSCAAHSVYELYTKCPPLAHSGHRLDVSPFCAKSGCSPDHSHNASYSGILYPPQGPVILSGWISRPGRTPGSTIYYPPGTDPSASGSTFIRLMPPGSTPVPGLEYGYWISEKNGQPINPATGGTGSRGETHVPLPPNTMPPKRWEVFHD